jgi:DNA modification methylase
VLTWPDINIRLEHGDCLDVLRSMDASSINCCVTSPPYWGLRDYGVDGQLGLEENPEEYVTKMVAVFREVRRVLREDGTVWLNLGDSYAGGGRGGNPPLGSGFWKQATNAGSLVAPSSVPTGLKPKDLVGIPWRVAFALQADGWYLRQDIIWHKPNPMPESVTDRCTKAHEYIFLLSKSARYYYDAEAVDEEGVVVNSKRNRRSVWTVTTMPYKGAHFATFPPKLIEPCILAGCPVGGVVLDPFVGSGTTSVVCVKHNRGCVGIDVNKDYLELAKQRIDDAARQIALPLFEERPC